MGIDARIETERGEPLAAVLDPRAFMPWALSLHPQESTLCLRFIDLYGNTTFNGIQLPILLSELREARSSLTNRRLDAAKEEYQQRAASWPEPAKEEAAVRAASLSIDDIRQHLDEVISLVQDAIVRGPHHYVKFIGD